MSEIYCYINLYGSLVFKVDHYKERIIQVKAYKGGLPIMFIEGAIR